MLTVAELVDRRLQDAGDEPERLLVVDLDSAAPDALAAASTATAAAIVARAAVLVGCTQRPLPPGLALVDQMDVVLSGAGHDHDDDERVVVGDVGSLIEPIRQTVMSSPIASLALTALLRITAVAPPEQGLIAESFAYSTLLAGPEHARWLAARPARPERRPSEEPVVVLVPRDGGTLEVTLADPDRRNAFGRRMRDALVEALQILDADDTVTEVRLRGEGPAFCSGGDLDEFGTTPDPATAHLIRTTRSVAALLWRHRARVHAVVHGACIGAGVELPAFAGRVTARPDAVFQLPELAMGLIPGAGGCVSLPYRIGRQRTAYLALSGTRLDAATARRWGLVDELTP